VSRREPQAFADFVAARSGTLHRAAYLMVGDAQLAQDLVQEALTKAYVAWPRLRDPSAVESYTRKALTTTAIGWYRKKSWGERVVGALPEGAQPGHEADIDERAWLWQALQELPVRQRAAIVLRYYQDLTEAQTADAMGCAIGTVKSQVSAGLKKLRDRLGDEAGLIPHDLVEVIER
jgi:RNA polymerase sigma-70 factor (sigma-E family)